MMAVITPPVQNSALKPWLDFTVVIWGLRFSNASHRFIHGGWFQTLKRAGFKVRWLDDLPLNQAFVPRGAIVFGVDIASRWLPVRSDCWYVLHNLGDTELGQRIVSFSRGFINVQVWTNRDPQSRDEVLLPAVHYDPKSRTIFQPWGTPFAPVSWTDPRDSVLLKRSETEFWIGSIWDNEHGEGNAEVIAEWDRELDNQGITFVPTNRSIADAPSRYGRVIRQSAFGASIVGVWQRDNGYLPCRVFKNLSFGRLPVSNGVEIDRVFGGLAVVDKSLARLIAQHDALSTKEVVDRARESQQRLASYTYEAFLMRTFDALFS